MSDNRIKNIFIKIEYVNNNRAKYKNADLIISGLETIILQIS